MIGAALFALLNARLPQAKFGLQEYWQAVLDDSQSLVHENLKVNLINGIDAEQLLLLTFIVAAYLFWYFCALAYRSLRWLRIWWKKCPSERREYLQRLLESSFVFDLWSNIFLSLKKCLPYEWAYFLVNCAVPGGKKQMVADIWASANFAFAMLGVAAVGVGYAGWGLKLIISVWATARIFEIAVVLMNVMFFDRPKVEREYASGKRSHGYGIGGYERLALLLFQNYLEVILWFAALFSLFSGSFEYHFANGQSQSVTILATVYASFKVMTSFGFENIRPRSTFGYSLVMAEALIGLFMTIVVISRFVGLLPRPDTIKEAIIRADEERKAAAPAPPGASLSLDKVAEQVSVERSS